MALLCDCAVHVDVSYRHLAVESNYDLGVIFDMGMYYGMVHSKAFAKYSPHL